MKLLSVLFTALIVLGLATAALAEHEHKAPHNGTLIVLGEEFAHIELVLDSDKGLLTAYVLDGEAENPIRITQESFVMEGIAPVNFHAVNNPLTGESIGDTSEFAAQSDVYKGVKNFKGTLDQLTLKGQDFKNIEFSFPEGNEQDEEK